MNQAISIFNNNMRKTWMTLFLAMGITLGVQAQKTDTLQFMNNYRSFVGYVESQSQLDRHQVDSLAARQEELRTIYHQVKPQLNNAQVEEYNRLKGRYTKRMMAYYGDRVAEGAQNSADSISKAASRAGKAIGGFFNGLFGND